MAAKTSLMLRQIGLTLVEVIVTLIVLSVAATALLPMLRNVLPRSPDSSEIIRATHLAQSRMELILGQRAAAGFSGINDPCLPPLSVACSVPTGYSIMVSGVSEVLGWSNMLTSEFRLITVGVTGQSGSILSINAVVTNY